MRYTSNRKPPKVAAAASSDASRPALEHVWFDAEAGELRATDSYIAARVPVSPDPGDATGWVSKDALERSRKRDAGAIALNGTANVYEVLPSNGEPTADDVVRRSVAMYPRDYDGTPPRLEQLWPVERDGFTVGLNAGFLKRLADALGAADSVVELTFAVDGEGRPNPLRAILVRTKDHATERGDGCGGLAAPEGLIMPVRVS